MKGFLVVLLDIVAIIGLTAVTWVNRGCFTVGGEVLLIAAMLIGSMIFLCRNETNVSHETFKRRKEK